MIVLNFGHPLTGANLEQLSKLLGDGTTIGTVKDIRAQADLSRPFSTQAADLVESCHLTPDHWQRGGYVVRLPGLADLAASVLAAIHGRAGHFPAVLRLQPVVGALTSAYCVAEVILLQALRDDSRSLR